MLLNLIVFLGVWFISGYSLDKIYSKAGFQKIPKPIFWIPFFNMLLIAHLAFADWPAFPKQNDLGV